MNIDMCKDIEKYKESVVMGLNIVETICAAIALGAGTVTTLILVFIFAISIKFAIYIAMIPTILIGLLGFMRNKNGMTLVDVLRKKKLLKQYSNPLGYSSDQTEELIDRLKKEIEDESNNVNSQADEFERTKKKMIMLFIGVAVLGVLGTVGLIIYKINLR